MTLVNGTKSSLLVIVLQFSLFDTEFDTTIGKGISKLAKLDLQKDQRSLDNAHTEKLTRSLHLRTINQHRGWYPYYRRMS